MSELFSDGAYTCPLATNPCFLCFYPGQNHICPQEPATDMQKHLPLPDKPSHVLFSSPTFNVTVTTLWHAKLQGSMASEWKLGSKEIRPHTVLSPQGDAHCSKTLLMAMETKQSLPSVMGPFHKQRSTLSPAGSGAVWVPANFFQKLSQQGPLAKPPLIARWGNATLLCAAEQLVSEWGHTYEAHIRSQLRGGKWWQV